MAAFRIDDHTPIESFQPTDKGTGLILPDGFSGPADYAGVATPFPQDLILSWDEIKEILRERKRLKSTHRDIARRAGLKCKDQQRTNYCWINSPTYCLEYVRVMQNQRLVELSPASAGGPIKNFQNVGGYGRQALEWISERGLVPTEFWPDNAIDSRYYTDANRALALDNRASEWWVFPQNDLRAVMSCAVGLGINVSVGLNWWSHQVSYADGEEGDGIVYPIFRNSYGMSWQDEGYATLTGGRATPNDAVAPAVAFSS